MSLKSEYTKTLKSMDTEETFDLIFYRPIGFAWATIAKKLNIKPNAITIASIILGLGAGVCFYFNNIWYNLLGALLLIWANSFDSADGQLARMTGQYSRLGRILDGMAGDIWFAAIYIAICLRENVTSEFFSSYPWVIWVFAAITGIFHGIQASAADYYRQFHLYFIKGEKGSELEESSKKLLSQYNEIPWKGNFWKKLSLKTYITYTASQEKRTPWMQKFRRQLYLLYPHNIPEDLRQEFRKLSLPLMKYTNILSFNTRCFALLASILIFRMPWLYFAFEVTVLNIILIYMIRRHENICRDLTLRLENSTD